MHTDTLNKIVKAVFDAWRSGDANEWLSFFSADAKLYDDGSRGDFRWFEAGACGHDCFTSIDKIEDDGLTIYGQSRTKSRVGFKTCFIFVEGRLIVWMVVRKHRN